jgi:hypothetical protein
MFDVSTRTMQRWMQPINKRRRLAEEDRLALVAFAHRRHHEGASLRTIATDIEATTGVRRSAAWAHRALHEYTCPTCSGPPDGTCEQADAQEPGVQDRQMAHVNGAAL